MNIKPQQKPMLHDGIALPSDIVRCLVLCLVLLSTQVMGLTHSHTGELQTQADCELCLKLSSSDDVIVAASFSFEYSSSPKNFVSESDSLVDLSKPALRARAPPRYS